MKVVKKCFKAIDVEVIGGINEDAHDIARKAPKIMDSIVALTPRNGDGVVLPSTLPQMEGQLAITAHCTGEGNASTTFLAPKRLTFDDIEVDRTQKELYNTIGQEVHPESDAIVHQNVDDIIEMEPGAPMIIDNIAKEAQHCQASDFDVPTATENAAKGSDPPKETRLVEQMNAAKKHARQSLPPEFKPSRMQPYTIQYEYYRHYQRFRRKEKREHRLRELEEEYCLHEGNTNGSESDSQGCRKIKEPKIGLLDGEPQVLDTWTENSGIRRSTRQRKAPQTYLQQLEEYEKASKMRSSQPAKTYPEKKVPILTRRLISRGLVTLIELDEKRRAREMVMTPKRTTSLHAIRAAAKSQGASNLAKINEVPPTSEANAIGSDGISANNVVAPNTSLHKCEGTSNAETIGTEQQIRKEVIVRSLLQKTLVWTSKFSNSKPSHAHIQDTPNSSVQINTYHHQPTINTNNRVVSMISGRLRNHLLQNIAKSSGSAEGSGGKSHDCVDSASRADDVNDAAAICTHGDRMPVHQTAIQEENEIVRNFYTYHIPTGRSKKGRNMSINPVDDSEEDEFVVEERKAAFAAYQYIVDNVQNEPMTPSCQMPIFTGAICTETLLKSWAMYEAYGYIYDLKISGCKFAKTFSRVTRSTNAFVDKALKRKKLALGYHCSPKFPFLAVLKDYFIRAKIREKAGKGCVRSQEFLVKWKNASPFIPKAPLLIDDYLVKQVNMNSKKINLEILRNREAMFMLKLFCNASMLFTGVHPLERVKPIFDRAKFLLHRAVHMKDIFLGDSESDIQKAIEMRSNIKKSVPKSSKLATIRVDAPTREFRVCSYAFLYKIYKGIFEGKIQTVVTAKTSKSLSIADSSPNMQVDLAADSSSMIVPAVDMDADAIMHEATTTELQDLSVFEAALFTGMEPYIDANDPRIFVFLPMYNFLKFHLENHSVPMEAMASRLGIMYSRDLLLWITIMEGTKVDIASFDSGHQNGEVVGAGLQGETVGPSTRLPLQSGQSKQMPYPLWLQICGRIRRFLTDLRNAEYTLPNRKYPPLPWYAPSFAELRRQAERTSMMTSVSKKEAKFIHYLDQMIARTPTLQQVIRGELEVEVFAKNWDNQLDGVALLPKDRIARRKLIDRRKKAHATRLRRTCPPLFRRLREAKLLPDLGQQIVSGPGKKATAQTTSQKQAKGSKRTKFVPKKPEGPTHPDLPPFPFTTFGHEIVPYSHVLLLRKHRGAWFNGIEELETPSMRRFRAESFAGNNSASTYRYYLWESITWSIFRSHLLRIRSLRAIPVQVLPRSEEISGFGLVPIAPPQANNLLLDVSSPPSLAESQSTILSSNQAAASAVRDADTASSYQEPSTEKLRRNILRTLHQLSRHGVVARAIDPNGYIQVSPSVPGAMHEKDGPSVLSDWSYEEHRCTVCGLNVEISETHYKAAVAFANCRRHGSIRNAYNSIVTPFTPRTTEARYGYVGSNTRAPMHAYGGPKLPKKDLNLTCNFGKSLMYTTCSKQFSELLSTDEKQLQDEQNHESCIANPDLQNLEAMHCCDECPVEGLFDDPTAICTCMSEQEMQLHAQLEQLQSLSGQYDSEAVITSFRVITCDTCDCKVHPQCYGYRKYKDLPPSGTPWRCELCTDLSGSLAKVEPSSLVQFQEILTGLIAENMHVVNQHKLGVTEQPIFGSPTLEQEAKCTQILAQLDTLLLEALAQYRTHPVSLAEEEGKVPFHVTEASGLIVQHSSVYESLALPPEQSGININNMQVFDVSIKEKPWTRITGNAIDDAEMSIKSIDQTASQIENGVSALQSSLLDIDNSVDNARGDAEDDSSSIASGDSLFDSIHPKFSTNEGDLDKVARPSPGKAESSLLAGTCWKGGTCGCEHASCPNASTKLDYNAPDYSNNSSRLYRPKSLDLVRCEICDQPASGLAMKQVKNGGFAHVVCLVTNQLVQFEWGKRSSLSKPDTSIFTFMNFLELSRRDTAYCPLCGCVASTVSTLSSSGGYTFSKEEDPHRTNCHASCALRMGYLRAKNLTFGGVPDLPGIPVAHRAYIDYLQTFVYPLTSSHSSIEEGMHIAQSANTNNSFVALSTIQEWEYFPTYWNCAIPVPYLDFMHSELPPTDASGTVASPVPVNADPILTSPTTSDQATCQKKVRTVYPMEWNDLDLPVHHEADYLLNRVHQFHPSKTLHLYSSIGYRDALLWQSIYQLEQTLPHPLLVYVDSSIYAPSFPAVASSHFFSHRNANVPTELLVSILLDPTPVSSEEIRKQHYDTCRSLRRIRNRKPAEPKPLSKIALRKLQQQQEKERLEELQLQQRLFGMGTIIEGIAKYIQYEEERITKSKMQRLPCEAKIMSRFLNTAVHPETVDAKLHEIATSISNAYLRIKRKLPPIPTNANHYRNRNRAQYDVKSSELPTQYNVLDDEMQYCRPDSDPDKAAARKLLSEDTPEALIFKATKETYQMLKDIATQGSRPDVPRLPLFFSYERVCVPCNLRKTHEHGRIFVGRGAGTCKGKIVPHWWMSNGFETTQIQTRLDSHSQDNIFFAHKDSLVYEDLAPSHGRPAAPHTAPQCVNAASMMIANNSSTPIQNLSIGITSAFPWIPGAKAFLESYYHRLVNRLGTTIERQVQDAVDNYSSLGTVNREGLFEKAKHVIPLRANFIATDRYLAIAQYFPRNWTMAILSMRKEWMNANGVPDWRRYVDSLCPKLLPLSSSFLTRDLQIILNPNRQRDTTENSSTTPTNDGASNDGASKVAINNEVQSARDTAIAEVIASKVASTEKTNPSQQVPDSDKKSPDGSVDNSVAEEQTQAPKKDAIMPSDVVAKTAVVQPKRRTYSKQNSEQKKQESKPPSRKQENSRPIATAKSVEVKQNANSKSLPTRTEKCAKLSKMQETMVAMAQETKLSELSKPQSDEYVWYCAIPECKAVCAEKKFSYLVPSGYKITPEFYQCAGPEQSDGGDQDNADCITYWCKTHAAQVSGREKVKSTDIIRCDVHNVQSHPRDTTPNEILPTTRDDVSVPMVKTSHSHKVTATSLSGSKRGRNMTHAVDMSDSDDSSCLDSLKSQQGPNTSTSPDFRHGERSGRTNLEGSVRPSVMTPPKEDRNPQKQKSNASKVAKATSLIEAVREPPIRKRRGQGLEDFFMLG